MVETWKVGLDFMVKEIELQELKSYWELDRNWRLGGNVWFLGILITGSC